MRQVEWADEYTWEFVPGVAVSCLETGQVWDASHWTREDWDEFRQPGHDRLAQVEQMTGYPSWEALRDGCTHDWQWDDDNEETMTCKECGQKQR